MVLSGAGVYRDILEIKKVGGWEKINCALMGSGRQKAN